ncbi:MAG TPA: YfiR family protein [Verrucomicrobiae bacterium]|jgi:hypothetical protein
MPFLNSLLRANWIVRAALIIALLFAGQEASSAQNTSTAYKFKAVFLFHFTQFVDWPATTFSDPQAPLVIGILGDDPFGDFLDATVKGENVDGHPLVVQRYRKPADVKDCQVLFISSSEQSQLGRTLTDLKGKTILTVSDMGNFAEDGGMIGFVAVQDKIHFQINTDAARDANLTLSSKLLRLADIVTTEKK